MKRAILILSAAGILLFLLAACAGAGKKEFSNNGNAPPAQTDRQNKPADADSGKKKESGIVAKSGNAVTGEDSGALIDELDRELDTLFSGIDKLEDVEDSDLAIDE